MTSVKMTKRRADHAVLGARQRDREEDARLRRAQRVGGLVEPRVGHRQRGDQDDQRVREAVEHLRDDDAAGAVDRAAEQQVLEEALVAEQVDERDRRQQRRRQDRDERERLEQPLPAHAAALQRVGVDEGERQHDRRRDQRDEQAVPHRVEQRRRREVVDVVGQADELAVLVLEALRQQRPQRQDERRPASRRSAGTGPARISRSSRSSRRRTAGGAVAAGAAAAVTASAAPGEHPQALRRQRDQHRLARRRSTGRARR